MKIIKSAFLTIAIFLLFSVSVFAEVYTSDYPSYVPVSGGAWVEVQTSQGRVCIVFPKNYQFDTFSFTGSSGYNITNNISSTVSGYIYKDGSFSYYGSPSQLQCRFTAMDTLQVYEPYQSTYGGTSYRWTYLNTSAIYNTNIAFMDDKADRQNNDYIYTFNEKLLIIIVCAVVFSVLFNILRRAWRA